MACGSGVAATLSTPHPHVRARVAVALSLNHAPHICVGVSCSFLLSATGFIELPRDLQAVLAVDELARGAEAALQHLVKHALGPHLDLDGALDIPDVGVLGGHAWLE